MSLRSKCIQLHIALFSQAILNHWLRGVLRIPKVVQGVRIIITLPYGGFSGFPYPSKTLLNINTVVSAMFADLLLEAYILGFEHCFLLLDF